MRAMRTGDIVLDWIDNNCETKRLLLVLKANKTNRNKKKKRYAEKSSSTSSIL
jgi:hypothetical protein